MALISQLAFAQQQKDWLVAPVTAKAEVKSAGQDVVLTNGLVKRAFRIAPNVACFDYVNLSNGQQLLRAVKPEARIGLNGKEYNVGGLYGQKENAYLLHEWLGGFTAGSSDFQYVKHEVSDIKPRVQWKAAYWAGNKNKPPVNSSPSFTGPARRKYRALR